MPDDPLCLREYLTRCLDSHPGCAKGLLNKGDAPDLEIMLIDVKERRLVKTPLRTAPKYIILSYVWGQVSQLQTTTSNLANLQEGESLATEEALLQIPQVIKDAMDITTELEEQFLWVDSLCICQDDAGSKHDQIRTMGTIYSCALATLIPLTGTDASTTLSQRRRRSNRASHQEPKAIALEQEIYNSTYAQRGWTFQERILSTRCIFFGAKEGYFACHRSCIRDGTEYYESQDILPTRLRLLNPLLLGAAPDSCFTTGNGTSDQQFEIYMNIVQSYTAKNFTYPGDILPAFDGICEVLRGRFRWTMHLGLPQNFLFQSLLWTTNSERQQATFYGHNDSTQYRIPSWTWAGWAGSADYSLLPLYSYSYHAKTTPAIHLLKSYLSTVSLLEWQDNAWKSTRIVEKESQNSSEIEGLLAALDISKPLAIPTNTFYLDFCAKTTPFSCLDSNHESRLKFIRTGPTGDEYFPHQVIWLSNGTFCGILYGIGSRNLPMYMESLDIIWLGAMPWHPEIKAWDYPSRRREPMSGSQVLVMLVTWKGGVAERLAIGHVQESALLAAGGVEKRIILG